MSHVTSRKRCPRCRKEERDTSQDNLVCYSDGHSHCFACGFSIRASSIETLRSKLNTKETPIGLSTSSLVLPLSYDLPPIARSWLSSYGITESEIIRERIAWNPEKESLVFPIYDGEILVATNERYFGTNQDHPKYYTSGRIHQYYQRMGTGPICCIVEDFVSAIKIARQFAAIPLFYSVVAKRLILNLVESYQTIYIWLDRDKAKESIKAAARCRQWIPNCGTIISEHDPKCYTDEEIREYIIAALPPDSQSLSSG